MLMQTDGLISHELEGRRPGKDVDASKQSYGRDENFDFSEAYESIVKKFETEKSPVTVNFRKLVPLHSGVDRATHLLHSYPAKLLPNIPLFLLGCQQFGKPGKLFDPFCGSGTTLVEGALRGWLLAGADSNPLARMITRTKLTYIDPAVLRDAMSQIEAVSAERPITFAPVVDVDMWFSHRAKAQIGSLLEAISRVTFGEVKQFFDVCLSACLRKASFADPRLSVPVRVKPNTAAWEKAAAVDVFELFRKAVAANIRRVATLAPVSERLHSLVIDNDARSVGAKDIDLIITSPPYAGAQKYVRASTFSLGWLNLAPENRLRPLERLSIGREHFSQAEYIAPTYDDTKIAGPALRRIHAINPLRAHIASTYLQEMASALQSSVARLKSGARAVIVIGNNTVCGEEFETSRYILEICEGLGLRLEVEMLDDIRSRGLMTKRNKTAGIIHREHIQVYRMPQ